MQKAVTTSSENGGKSAEYVELMEPEAVHEAQRVLDSRKAGHEQKISVVLDCTQASTAVAMGPQAQSHGSATGVVSCRATSLWNWVPA